MREEPSFQAARQPFRRRSERKPSVPYLRFSPTAWAKLLFLRDCGQTEVGGFGIASANDLLFVEDVQLVRQSATGFSVAFDDEAVADFFDQQIDLGRKPQQFARVWVHTHPGNCPLPSMTDDDTFQRVFGQSDWALMFVLAQGGATYARLRFNAGPGGEMEIPTSVDYSRPFAGSDQAAWEDEYCLNVFEPLPLFYDREPLPLDRDFDVQDARRPVEPFGADAEMLLDDQEWEELLTYKETLCDS
jgi:hypothetical protein